jgi:hypothetical protein
MLYSPTLHANRPAARRLRWWCCKDPAELTASGRKHLHGLYERCPDLLTMQHHLTGFMKLVRQQERSALEGCLAASRADPLTRSARLRPRHPSGLRCCCWGTRVWVESRGCRRPNQPPQNDQAPTVWSGKPPGAQATRSSHSCLMEQILWIQTTSIHHKERRTRKLNNGVDEACFALDA